MDIIWGSCFKGEIYMNFPLSENLSGHINCLGKSAYRSILFGLKLHKPGKKIMKKRKRPGKVAPAINDIQGPEGLKVKYYKIFNICIEFLLKFIKYSSVNQIK
jgi:hypothetical protein